MREPTPAKMRQKQAWDSFMRLLFSPLTEEEQARRKERLARISPEEEPVNLERERERRELHSRDQWRNTG